MTDRITRNRKGVLHVNGTPIRVPKTADHTDTEVLHFVQKCAEWAPGARWDFSMLEIGALNRAAEAIGIPSPAESLSSTLERKIDLILGVMQDMRAQMKTSVPNRQPSGEWISTTETAALCDCSPQLIQKWIRNGRFPREVVRRKQRGQQWRYLLRSEKALPLAMSFLVGED